VLSKLCKLRREAPRSAETKRTTTTTTKNVAVFVVYFSGLAPDCAPPAIAGT
jgi:hypothetical protein